MAPVLHAHQLPAVNLTLTGLGMEAIARALRLQRDQLVAMAAHYERTAIGFKNTAGAPLVVMNAEATAKALEREADSVSDLIELVDHAIARQLADDARKLLHLNREIEAHKDR